MDLQSTSKDMVDKYEVLECVGKGSFGDVFRGIDTETGEEVAIKIIDLDEAEEDIEEIKKEISVLSMCRSKYVTQYYTALLIPGTTRLWIVMEYMSGGALSELLQRFGPFEEDSIAVIMYDILCALQYLHGEGKIHRDIKAANVLLTDTGGVKLADFGVSGQLTHTLGARKRTFVGTPFWMAPEVIETSETGYDEKADIWSLGITAIELAKGEPPNTDKHPMQVLFLIPKNPPPRLEENFSVQFRDFVASCLHKDPGERPSASELLGHPFVRPVAKAERPEELLSRIADTIERRKARRGSMDSESDAGLDGTWRSMDGSLKWDFGTQRPSVREVYDRPRIDLDALARGGTIRMKSPPALDAVVGADALDEGDMQRHVHSTLLYEVVEPALRGCRRMAPASTSMDVSELLDRCSEDLEELEERAPGSTYLLLRGILRRLRHSSSRDSQSLRSILQVPRPSIAEQESLPDDADVEQDDLDRCTALSQYLLSTWRRPPP